MTRNTTRLSGHNPHEQREFTLGTRKSQLALWQANYIVAMLKEQLEGFRCQLEPFITEGDRKLEAPLPEIGGKGLFTQVLEEALRSGQIDLVVHSLKDLPVEEAPGLTVAANPIRENAHDVLISAQYARLEDLPQGARLGTSSLRRSAQILHIRSDLRILPLRGNVDTRIRKAMEGQYDAIILAAAGVHRLELDSYIRQELPFELMLPAPGQGALAVQCRADDSQLRQMLGEINHAPTQLAVSAERAFLQGTGGGCSAPIAAYAQLQHGFLHLEGLVASPEGKEVIRVRGDIPGNSSEEEARQLGHTLAQRALQQGADQLVEGLLKQ